MVNDRRHSEAPFCEKMTFHRSGDGGYAVFRVPGLITTRRGTVLAWYDARKGTGRDYDPIDIMLKRSFDHGKTWEEARVLMGHERYRADRPINNLVLFADQVTGDVHGLFCTNYERLFYFRSTDEGETFSEPVDITHVAETYRDRYDWKVIAPGPGHGIQLSSGRLVIPMWMSTGESGEFGPGYNGHRPSDLVSLYSDDHGRTWHPGPFVARTCDKWLHPNETTAVELSDGRVLFNIRSESRNLRLIATSRDGASDWSEPEFDPALPDPICFGSLIRLRDKHGYDKAPILFSNLSDLSGEKREEEPFPDVRITRYERRGLTIKASVDDCRTWPLVKTLEAGAAQYSDLTVAHDGSILCLYEQGAKSSSGDERALVLARFNWAWIIEQNEEKGDR